jgi:hypothetical protein
VALVVALAAMAAAPAAAGACPSLAGLRGFHGSGSASFNATASGEIPGTGGVETVTLARRNSSQRIDLGGKVKGKTVHVGGKTIRLATIFLGRAHGGSITIGDRRSATGSSVVESLSAAGPLKLPGAGAAAVVLFPQVCAYQLEFSFDEATAPHGAETVQSGLGAGGSALTPKRRIPASLKLSGGAGVSAYYSGCSDSEPPDEQGCYQFSDGFATDFVTLQTCHSIVAVGCSSDEEPMGDAHVSWNLTPAFAKKHRHRH